MDKIEDSEVAGPGPGTSNGTAKPVPSVADIEKLLSRDLSICLSLMQALLTDKDLRLHMATFLQGRYSNAVVKPDPAQADLFPKR